MILDVACALQSSDLKVRKNHISGNASHQTKGPQGRDPLWLPDPRWDEPSSNGLTQKHISVGISMIYIYIYISHYLHIYVRISTFPHIIYIYMINVYISVYIHFLYTLSCSLQNAIGN